MTDLKTLKDLEQGLTTIDKLIQNIPLEYNETWVKTTKLRQEAIKWAKVCYNGKINNLSILHWLHFFNITNQEIDTGTTQLSVERSSLNSTDEELK